MTTPACTCGYEQGCMLNDLEMSHSYFDAHRIPDPACPAHALIDAQADARQARAELAEVRDQLGRAEHFVGCIIQAFHRAGLNDFNLRDIDANIAEVRRQTAQRCADTAVTARERWHARNDASAEVAAGCIAQDIRREFSLAEQPPQPQPSFAEVLRDIHAAGGKAWDDVSDPDGLIRYWRGYDDPAAIKAGEEWQKRAAQPVSPPAQDAGDRQAVIERATKMSKNLRDKAEWWGSKPQTAVEATDIADTLDALLEMKVNP